MLDIDDAVALVPGERAPAAPLGRVVAVSGAQVTVEFATDPSSPLGDDIGVTVGSLLGIETGELLAIGALCDIALQTSPAGTIGSRLLTCRVGVQVSGDAPIFCELQVLAATYSAFNRWVQSSSLWRLTNIRTGRKKFPG